MLAKTWEFRINNICQIG